MYYGYGLDITYIFVIIGMIITLSASWRMKATFAKYEREAEMIYQPLSCLLQPSVL